MTQIDSCEEGRQLKKQYESALHGWEQSASLSKIHSAGNVSEADIIRLREAALAERNVAADRMYLHRSRCALCRRQR
jgi:hypothetical protein